MSPFRSALVCLVLAAVPQIAAAQTTAAQTTAAQTGDPGADLLIMQQKAEAKPELRGLFAQFLRTGQRPEMQQMLEQQVLGGRIARRGLDQPYPYAAMADFQLAQNRAQIWGQLLAADLNNDEQISKEEVTTVLQLGQRSGVADAFFASDANGDSILSHDELRSEVERQTGQGDRYYDRSAMAAVFDFDNDGSLTRDEMDRGMAALGYTKP